MNVCFSADEIGPPRVKFCGMTRREDAVAAADLGADAVGFVFWPSSPRAITPQAAHDIVRALPAPIDKVGVFVDEKPDVIREIAAFVGLTTAQLHGDESPDASTFGALRTIKAVAAHDGDLDTAAYEAGGWPDDVTLLVDARDPVRRGGTGQRADWSFARALTCMRPVILAGGLRPENVIEAVHAVLPFAVDVSSGVEQSPGVKDRARMREFVSALRYGWGWLQMGNEERWRARVQFRDAAPRGLGRARQTPTASEMRQ
jgi:phosphoribosylanthranilate isomerase